MTVWGKFFRERVLPPVRLERLPAPDGDVITLATFEAPANGPVLLILHGLEGGLRSHYVGGLVATALQHGWRPVLQLFRTCDGRAAAVRRTYHSGETSDLDHVVRALVDRHPDSAFGIVGVSLGGNVLLKWLGEQGEAAPAVVRAAAAVSVPYDLARCSRAIDSGFSRLYQWNFMRSLRKKARWKVAQFPDVLPAERVERLRTMWEFDDAFTAPLHGFRDAADYYHQCSSIRYLDRIRRPTLLLSAFDDPFHTPDVLRDVAAACATSRFLVPEFHRRGGHVGFVGGAPWRPTYYVDQRIAEFLAPYLTHEGRRGGDDIRRP